MNKFKLFTFWIIFMELLLIIFINVHILGENQGSTGRLYLVESKRIRKEIEEQNVTKHQIETMDLGKYEAIVGIREFVAGENGRYDYLVEEIDGTLYRMEYVTEKNNRMSIYVNLSLFGMVFVTMMVLWYVHHKILKPFWNMSDLSFESAKGNLSMPVKEEKILYVQDMMNFCVRKQLEKVLSWKVGVKTDFSVSVGKSAKYLSKWLEQEEYQKYLSTYAIGNTKDCWRAVFEMTGLFSMIAKNVAEELGYTYNFKEEKACMDFLKLVRNLPRDAEEIVKRKE